MGNYRIYLASAAAIMLFVVAAVLWNSHSVRYFPLVRVVMPEQGELIFLDSPWTSLEKCYEANLKIMNSLRSNCSQCRIEQSCESQELAAWQQTLAGQPIEQYVVSSGTKRIVVKAGAASKQVCTMMASQMAQDKKLKAECVAPK